MSRITYHVNNKSSIWELDTKFLEETIDSENENLKKDEKLIDLFFTTSKYSDEVERFDDIIDYISHRINKRVKKELIDYSHTLMFYFDDVRQRLFVSWSSVTYPDIFSKQFGYEMSNLRMNELLDFFNDDEESYTKNAVEVPTKVIDSIWEFLPKVKKYFKQIPENFDFVENMIIY